MPIVVFVLSKIDSSGYITDVINANKFIRVLSLAYYARLTDRTFNEVNIKIT